MGSIFKITIANTGCTSHMGTSGIWQVSKILLLINLTITDVFGQSDSCWNLLLIGKGEKLQVKPEMSKYSQTGFYLYRNCIYDIILKSGKEYSCRLIDIKPDTLYFSNFFNSNVAKRANSILDTFAINYRQLDKLKLIADRSIGWYEKHSFDNLDFIFKKDTISYIIKSYWEQIFFNDTSKYEIAPHLSAQGVTYLFEEGGLTFYFYHGGMYKPDRSLMDLSYDVKNIIWFTPNDVEKINGLAIGLYPENTKNYQFHERDSLVINGLNLTINPWAIFSLLNPRFTGPFPDSIELYNELIVKDWSTEINGLNFSLVNTTGGIRLNGFSLSSLITITDETRGFQISGLSNFSYILKGVSISMLYNRAMIAKGIQIGLYNKSKDMRGIQLGLVNINGKRTLPFINWQFNGNKKP